MPDPSKEIRAAGVKYSIESDGINTADRLGQNRALRLPQPSKEEGDLYQPQVKCNDRVTWDTAGPAATRRVTLTVISKPAADPQVSKHLRVVRAGARFRRRLTGAKHEIPSVLLGRATMIDDNTSHRVFKIGELTRLIASHALPSRNGAMNFSCTCRYLEEPVLRKLWETQRLFQTL